MFLGKRWADGCEILLFFYFIYLGRDCLFYYYLISCFFGNVICVKKLFCVFVLLSLCIFYSSRILEFWARGVGGDLALWVCLI